MSVWQKLGLAGPFDTADVVARSALGMLECLVGGAVLAFAVLTWGSAINEGARWLAVLVWTVVERLWK